MNILSWQFDDKYEGGKKAKARAIVLAYQYPLYAEGPTAAPTSSRGEKTLFFHSFAAGKKNQS